VQLIPGFMQREEMYAVQEYLTSVDKPCRADDYRFVGGAVAHGARPDGHLGLRFSNLVAPFPIERALLSIDYFSPRLVVIQYVVSE
jgi:hypothetical protein